MLYLFDIDGTLMWSGGAGSVALEAVFLRHHGVEGAMSTVSASGKTDPLIIAEMFTATLGRAPTSAESSTMASDYEAALPDALAASERFRLLPHVFAVLDALAADDAVTLSVATGNSENAANAKLVRGELSHYFIRGGYGSDSADRAALVAIAIGRAQRQAGRVFDAREIVVVGDTPRDVFAAHTCGVRSIAVETGYPTRDELRRARPDALIRELDELLPWHRAQRDAGA